MGILSQQWKWKGYQQRDDHPETIHVRHSKEIIAVKENIVRVGEHPAGIGLYLFDYTAEVRDIAGHGRKFGVMADEVAQVMPEAVSIAADGYRQVDYAMLGITFH